MRVRLLTLALASLLLAPAALAQVVQVKRPTLMVSDMDASLAVYRDLLGFDIHYLRGDLDAEREEPLSLAYTYFDIDPKKYDYTRFATLDTPQQTRALGLIELRGRRLPRTRPRTQTVVVQVEDVDALAPILTGAGLEVLPATDEAETPEGDVYKEMPFVDPDGHVVVLYHLRPGGADLDLLVSWFGGRFDNHVQVLHDEHDGVEHPHRRVHSIFEPVQIPELGEHLFYVEQYSGGDPDRVFRQRLYRFEQGDDDEIVLHIHAFADPDAVRGAHDDPTLLDGLTLDDLEPKPGCEVYWRRVDDHFEGATRPGACHIRSRAGGVLSVEDTLYLDRNELHIDDRATNEAGELVFGHPEGVPYALRRAHLFDGWGALLDEGADRWTLAPGVVLHDQGGEFGLVDEEGQELPWVVSLSQRVYGRTNTPILKLAVHRRGEEKSHAYIWADPGAERIGLNLGDVQIGLTRRAEDEESDTEKR